MKTAKQILKRKQFIKKEMDRQFPKEVSDALWRKAEKKLDEILKQHQSIPAGEHAHTDNFIFPTAAVYLTLLSSDYRDSAYSMIENAAVTYTEKAGRALAGFLKLPGMKSLFIKIWDPMTKKKFGPDCGFENVFYPKKKNEYRMDIVSCPYVRYFTELGCPELTKIYCANDDRVYGNLPGLEFKRAGTLGTGADRCDFYLRKK